MQVDFLKAALEESVLDMVGCVLQHVEDKRLREDASIALDILYGVYVSFDPRAVFDADLQDAAQRSRCEFHVCMHLTACFLQLHMAASRFPFVVVLSTVKHLCRAQPASKGPGGGSDAPKRSHAAPGRNQPPAHPTISHMNVRKPASKQPSRHPGVRLIGQSGEQAYYVRSTPGMLGHTVLKNAAKTKAAIKVHATVNASNAPRIKSTTTHRQLLARYAPCWHFNRLLLLWW